MNIMAYLELFTETDKKVVIYGILGNVSLIIVFLFV